MAMVKSPVKASLFQWTGATGSRGSCICGLALLLVSTITILLAGCDAGHDATVLANQKKAVPSGGTPGPASISGKAEQRIQIPANTPIHVRLLQSVSSRNSSSGEKFQAELSAPIAASAGEFLRGARVRGRVAAARHSGRLRSPGMLRLTLDSIQTVDGRWVNVSTTAATFSAKSHKRRNLTLVGGGTGVGALIGGVAGGGTGLAIGAASGAAAGLTGAYITGKKDVTLPAESLLTLKTTREVAWVR
jgi:hypothetical protein